MKSVFRNLLRNTQGQATVEFALMLPIVIILLFGLIEIGITLCSQQIITYAVREGARAGALTNDNDQIRGAIRTTIQYIDPENTRTKIQIIPEEESAASRVRGNPLTVKIEYSVPLHVPLVSEDQIVLKSESTARIEK